MQVGVVEVLEVHVRSVAGDEEVVKQAAQLMLQQLSHQDCVER